jgi:hypothetical protein
MPSSNCQNISKSISWQQHSSVATTSLIIVHSLELIAIAIDFAVETTTIVATIIVLLVTVAANICVTETEYEFPSPK